MPGYVIVETQWGDEGKDKVVDCLGSRMDAIVRFQGGNNAGHIIVAQDKHTRQNQQVVLHPLPSGVLQKASCIIGPGVIVDPSVFLEEINQPEEHGSNTDHILLSDCSHIIIPYHTRLDTLIEASLKDRKIGATKRGVDPCYAGKYSRQKLRIGNLQDFENFKKELKLAVDMKSITFQKMYGDPGFFYEELVAQFAQIRKTLLPRIINAQTVTNQVSDAQKQILFEGAQAATLDINYRSYPYVTSSSPIPTGACTGAGVSPKKLDVIIGTTKTYSTRVGEGSLVSKLFDDVDTWLREQGHGSGATTKRPRCYGWLDVSVVRHAAMIDGLNDLAITKLDTLSGLEKIHMCVAYDIDGVRYDCIPSSMEELQRAKPIYEEFDGQREGISTMKTYEELPEDCKIYLCCIEELYNA